MYPVDDQHLHADRFHDRAAGHAHGEVRCLQRAAHRVNAAGAGPGTVLFAASMAEIREGGRNSVDLSAVASDVMWDAALNSIPEISSEANIVSS